MNVTDASSEEEIILFIKKQNQESDIKVTT